ncbi:MAG: RNA polymerase sigma factor [Lachnospiraceae bacterium]
MTEIEKIYREYFRDVYLYILGLSEDEHVAEEVVGETFLRAMEALPGFRGECDIRVWLCQIAKHTFISYCRKNKRIVLTDFAETEGKEKSQRDILTSTMTQSAKTVSLEEQLVDSETAAAVHQKLHELSEPYKEVFHLRVFGELSFEQIGKIFGKTANWACVTYHRAKAKLQKEVEDL